MTDPVQGDDAVRERERLDWRVGNHYGIHVYAGDRPVATFFKPEEAAEAVKARNALRASEPVPGAVPGAVGVSVEAPADADRLAEQLEVMQRLFQWWIDFNTGNRAREGLDTVDDTALMSPPTWPTHRVLKAWVSLLANAQDALTPRTVEPDPASGADAAVAQAIIAEIIRQDGEMRDDGGMMLESVSAHYVYLDALLIARAAMLAARPSPPNAPIRGAGSFSGSVADRADGDSERVAALSDLSSSPRDAGEAETVDPRSLPKDQQAAAWQFLAIRYYDVGQRLRQERDQERARVADLERQIAGAGEVIEPFVEFCERNVSDEEHDQDEYRHFNYNRALNIKIGHLRRAATFLASLKETSRGE